MSFQSWLVLIAVGILVFLINIDYTAVNLTLVPISEEINAGLNSLQWLLSGYVLVWAAFVVLAGRLADLYGKRNSLIAGLLVFLVGSCLTGYGHTLDMLVVGRIFQGVGAALFSAPAWALVFESAPPERQGFLMGIIISFAGFGLAIGPTLAGVIIEELSWRWIFYVNIPLGFLVIAILLFFAPKDIIAKNQKKINFPQAGVLAGTLCLSVYALNQVGTTGFTLFGSIVVACAWGALISSFMQHKYKGVANKNQKAGLLTKLGRGEVLIPLHLFKNKPYLGATVGVGLMSMVFSMTLVMMGLYLQNTLHYSSYQTGLIFIAMTISMGLLGPVGGKMVDLLGTKQLMVFGTLLTFFALGMMAFLGIDSSLFYVILCLFLVGAGLGMYFTASNTAMMQVTPPESLGVASGVYMMWMMLGNTVSIVLSTSLVVVFGRIHLLGSLREMTFTPQQNQDLVDIIGKVEHTAAQLKDFAPETIPQLLQRIDEAFAFGLSLNMILGIFLALGTLGFTLWGCAEKKSNPSKKKGPENSSR
jgi:MFS family permease